MREGWKISTLGEIYDIEGGKVQTGPFGSQLHESDYKEFGVAVIMPKDIIDDKLDESRIARISQVDANRLKNHIVLLNDIIFPRRGDIGKRIIIKHNHIGAFCGTGCIKLRGTGKILDPTYLFYFLKQQSIVQWIEMQAIGATMLNLNTSIIRSIPICFPMLLSAQRKIASSLSAYDDLIENNLKRIKLLEEKAQLTYEEWFVKMRFPGYETAAFDEVTGLPEGWKEGKLSDLIDYQSGFAFKSSKFKEKGYPIIKIKNIGNNTIDFNNVDYIDIEYANQVEKFQLNAGDLLIAMTGATVGKVGIMPKLNVQCYLNQRVGRFISLKSIDNKAFIECFFNIGSGLNQVLNIAGGAAQPNISANQILAIETIVPSDTILKYFSQMAISITNSVINLQNQNHLLKEVRDILLPRLMSGMIDVEELQIGTLQIAN
jgi:type I restriction enzyme S subunit